MLIILFILLSTVPLVVALLFGIKPNETEFSIGILSIFFSALSFIGIIITIWHQISNAKKQQDEINRNFQLSKDGYNLHLLNHIDTLFLSEKYQYCRFRIWSFWTEYNKNEKVKKEIREIIKDSICDFWCNDRKKAEKLFETERFKDFTEIIRFIRYFDLISRFSFDKITINAIHFYYTYYRNFFITISELYNKEYYCLLSLNETSISQSLQSWHDIVERMDALMLSFELPVSSTKKIDNPVDLTLLLTCNLQPCFTASLILLCKICGGLSAIQAKQILYPTFRTKIVIPEFKSEKQHF